MSTIIDSHAHLSRQYFGDELEDVIKRSREKQVVQIVQAGVDLDGIPEMIELSERYEYIYFASGIHPHASREWTSSCRAKLQESMGHPKNVAVGECGLDFYYDLSDRQTQRDVFSCQVKLARQLAKPLIIHTREAWEETFAVLKEDGAGEVRGVFHCFTGGPELLSEIAALDFYISFSGIITFHNAHLLQEAAALVPADRIMVETDCPYLTPHPLRGKRNEPGNVWLTVDKLAQLRHTEVGDIATRTCANARRLFGLPS